MILNSIDRNVEDAWNARIISTTSLETQYKLSTSKVYYELNLGNDARLITTTINVE